MSKWRGLTMRALCEGGISMSSKVLLAYLCERADKTRLCWPGRDTVLDDTKMSRPSFFRARAELLAAGLLADRSDDKEGCLEVYPESQIETAESQIETDYRCINSSRTPIEPSNEPPIEAGTTSPKLLPVRFWARFVDRCGKAWGLPEKMAKRASAGGLVVPMPEHSQLIEGGRQALLAGYTEPELMHFADWIAAGGLSWHGAAWSHVARRFLPELSKSVDWDGKSDPRRHTPPARASPPARRDQLTSSKTAETNEISGIEGLKKIGINIPEGAVSRATREGNERNDRAF